MKDYTLRPYRGDRRSGERRKALPSPAQPLDATQFRAFGWSVRGPKRLARWADYALALGLVAMALGLVLFPFALMALVLREVLA